MHAPEVLFFFGVGSRYSYLAATQLADIAAQTGARFSWRAVHSPELIARTGADPFAPETRRGQYEAGYRTRDAMRWAAYYAVPYSEPDWPSTDWRRLALACVAAEMQGGGERFAMRLLGACFGAGAPPGTDEELSALATAVGFAGDAFISLLRGPRVQERHEQHLQEALRAGAFGVPTFVASDGALFFGQDRLPLLRHHLAAKPYPQPV
jgi:2-hydroxychromene-2-carboxylate isomerase